MSITEYVDLSLRQMKCGQWVKLKCLRSTAEHYGWLDAFDAPFFPAVPGIERPRQLVRWTNKSPAHKGGSRLRVCKVSRKKGHPAGVTNCFRMTWGYTDRDLAVLARLIPVEWSWMENKRGKRINREQWLRHPIHPAVLEQHPLLFIHPALATQPRQAEGLAVLDEADTVALGDLLPSQP